MAIRRSRQKHGSTGTVLTYSALNDDFGVERRWLEGHAWDLRPMTDEAEAAEPQTETEVTALFEQMLSQLDNARSAFERRRGH
jgi:hypothetical protein